MQLNTFESSLISYSKFSSLTDTSQYEILLLYVVKNKFDTTNFVDFSCRIKVVQPVQLYIVYLCLYMCDVIKFYLPYKTLLLKVDKLTSEFVHIARLKNSCGKSSTGINCMSMMSDNTINNSVDIIGLNWISDTTDIEKEINNEIFDIFIKDDYALIKNIMEGESSSFVMNYQTIGDSGSLFGMEEYRKSMKWDVSQHTMQSVIKLKIVPCKLNRFEITPSVNWSLCKPGSQAGIYLYKDPLNWVKLVIERLKSGVYIILAEQIDGKPFVCGKVPLDGATAIMMDVNQSILGFYIKDGECICLKRGLGWKVESELEIGEKIGAHIDLNSSLATHAAVCSKINGNYYLLTEGWPAHNNTNIKFAGNFE